MGMQPQTAAIAYQHWRHELPALAAINSVTGMAVGATSPIFIYYATNGKYWPSNAQVWSAGKDASEVFSPALLDRISFGNTPAGKGHFILKAFDRDWASVSGITTLSAIRQQDTTRPSTIVSHFGRVFYSGTAEQSTQSTVYFSPVVGGVGDLERCYQVNDPTSDQVSDLLDTDGGAILILNCGSILSLKEFASGILVLATNGVWFIHGGQNTGFVATSYIVDRVTTTGCIGRDTVVSAEGQVFYWSDEGINVISVDKQGGVIATPLTDTTIRTFYNTIPSSSKAYAKGEYILREKKILWAYNSISQTTSHKFQKDSVLELDLLLGAFFPQRIKNLTTTGKSYTTPYIVAPFTKYFFGQISSLDPVTDGGVTVTDSGVTVTTTVYLENSRDSAVKYIAVSPQATGYKLVFTEATNTDFKDWESYDGTGSYFSSYAQTNPINLGEIMRDKQTQYLFSYFEVTESGYSTDSNGNQVFLTPSSCYASVRWNWTQGGEANKTTHQQQAYKLNRNYTPSGTSFNYDYQTTLSRLLIRGVGKTFSVRYDSENGKDFRLLGWALPATVGQTP